MTWDAFWIGGAIALFVCFGTGYISHRMHVSEPAQHLGQLRSWLPIGLLLGLVVVTALGFMQWMASFRVVAMLLMLAGLLTLLAELWSIAFARWSILKPFVGSLFTITLLMLVLRIWAVCEGSAAVPHAVYGPPPGSVSEAGAKRRLIVLLHGMGGPAGLDDVLPEAEDAEAGESFQTLKKPKTKKDQSPLSELCFEHADSRILLLRYSADDSWFTRWFSNYASNRDPLEATVRMAKAIQATFEKGEFEEVVLVGYSAGALFARKIFLYARGAASDLPNPDGKNDWHERVSRIVLLAGLNRGLDVSGNRPNDMSRGQHARLWFNTWLADLNGVGRLGMAMASGRPFVANLRMDWVRYIHEAYGEARQAGDPRDLYCVQLLGDIDNLVSERDESDLAVLKAVDNGRYTFRGIRVRGTGHDDIVQLFDSKKKRVVNGSYRREKLYTALSAEPLPRPAVAKPKVGVPPGPKRKHVVFVVHGIRDLGRWSAEFETKLKSDDPDTTVVLESPRYGYFGMGPFLLHFQRQKYVEWLMDEITESRARNPNAVFDFVGHSNGTYLLAHGLKEYASLRMRRVVFAASVVRTDHWTTSWIDQKKGLNAGAHRVDHLLNLPGRGDLVVGLLPRLFEIRPFGSLNPAVGAGGFLGFELPSDSTDGEEPRYRCRDGKNVWIKGGHSAFLDRGHKHVEHIAGYLRARCGNPECAGVDCAECDEEIERAVSRFKTEPHHPPLCKPVAGPRLGVVLTLLLWLVLVGVVSGIGFWLVTAAGAQASKVALAYLFVVGYVLVNV